MLRNLFLLGMFAATLASCGNDKNTTADTAAIQSTNSDVRSLEPIENSSLVSNPISADMPLNADEMAVIAFTETTIDFGTVKEGEVVTKSFEFTNNGKAPLVISDAKASCGCTVPEYPRSPIQPGEKGTIVAKFDSAKRPGSQLKNITITANTNPNQTVLTLKGEVIAVNPAQ